MTESSDGASNWWDSWIQSAKEKVENIASSETVEYMRRDIAEFTGTLQQDTASVISNTAAALREKLNVETGSTALEKAKEGVSSFLGTITDSLAGPSLDDDEQEIILIKDSQPIILDRSQAELYAIQTNAETFCREPRGPPELYEEWLANFKLNDHQNDLSELMIDVTELRNLYSKLVPSAVSHDEFWNRYYYRLHQLKEAENRRAALVKRVDQAKPDEETDDWDNVDDVVSKEEVIVEDVKKQEIAEKTPEDNSLLLDNLPQNEDSDLTEDKVNDILKSEDSKVVEEITDASSPAVDSDSASKESSLEEDWEKNFDLELCPDKLTSEEKEKVEPRAEKTSKDNPEIGDDWETWE